MPPEPRMDALVGTVLEGAYRITRLLGEGAMGAVYEAVQLRLNKRVAIKLMARDLAANREALARFHREAQITSHLGHPHLVTVIDFGTAESGEPYLVMEYLSGEDLEHRVRRVGRLSIESAVHITRQVASALAAAHGEGVVHRDLKPANVFLLQAPGEPDFVKVLDFGISKVKAAGTKLTQTSTLIGTPQYMSPEQAAGMIDQIDHRTDQWALGCIVWEMLSGRGPFVADDLATLLYQVINLDPQPLAARVPTLPPRVESVLRRALSKKLTDRYPAIEDFSRAFEAAAMGSGAEVTSPATDVPRVVSTKETVTYGSPPAAQVPLSPSPDVQLGRDTGKQPTTLSQAVGDLPHSTAGRRLKPAFAIAAGGAATGALVLLAALLLFHSGSAHKPKPTATSAAPAVTAPDHGHFKDVEYEPAKKGSLRMTAKKVKDEKFLSDLIPNLNAHFSLAKDLNTGFRECDGEKPAFYDPDNRKITICYEFVERLVERIEKGLSPDVRKYFGAYFVDSVVDPLTFFLFREVGHALVHIDQLPSTGEAEVAADQFATFAMLKLVKDGGEKALSAVSPPITLIGKNDSLDRDMEGDDEMQRAANIYCWVYGAHPEDKDIRSLARRFGVPKSRLDRCGEEYQSANNSWLKLVGPRLKQTETTASVAP